MSLRGHYGWPIRTVPVNDAVATPVVVLHWAGLALKARAARAWSPANAVPLVLAACTTTTAPAPVMASAADVLWPVFQMMLDVPVSLELAQLAVPLPDEVTLPFLTTVAPVVLQFDKVPLNE